jgi:hypothetical protein
MGLLIFVWGIYTELQILHQNIQNCQYFDCLFTHYVVMSYFYLYIIKTQQIKIDFYFPIYFN